MLLADLGADVIKIEQPGGGDPARETQRDLFAQVNRNKRSLTLNLKATEGRDLFLRLVDGADVLVEGFRPGVMQRLDLGYETLHARNPRLIYATLSGYGQAGPYRHRAGHDLNYIALAGVLGYNVGHDGQPVPPAVQVADLGAGTFAAVAILAAVIARQHSGRGQAVDVSLFASAIAWLPTLLGQIKPPGEPPLAGGLPRYNVYRTRDGRFVTLGALEPKFWLNFLERVGRTDLARVTDRQVLQHELDAVFASRSLGEWNEFLADVDTCFAPVNTLEETFADPQVRALRLFAESDGVRQIAPPFDFSETPAMIRRAAPTLGEHTLEVLTELGVTPDEARALARHGVV
jgi:crotonobetainyl-CoA:carnitine CoA-transferase CaiB-like acyl-CoA transferase